MSKEEMNAYRLTGTEEPTDEMLAALMKEVAEEAKRKSEETHKRLFQEIRDSIRLHRDRWNRQYDLKLDQ